MVQPPFADYYVFLPLLEQTTVFGRLRVVFFDAETGAAEILASRVSGRFLLFPPFRPPYSKRGKGDRGPHPPLHTFSAAGLVLFSLPSLAGKVCRAWCEYFPPSEGLACIGTPTAGRQVARCRGGALIASGMEGPLPITPPLPRARTEPTPLRAPHGFRAGFSLLASHRFPRGQTPLRFK